MQKRGRSAEDIDKAMKELQEPELIPAGSYLTSLFFDLNGARQTGMNGPLPISYTEIKAYLELNCEELEAWEISCLKIMDRAFLEEYYKMQNKEK